MNDKSPQWARNLVLAVATQENRKPPRLYWHRCNVEQVAGGYISDRNTIVVWVPTHVRCKPYEQKITLLHECAHWLCNDEGHSPDFWVLALGLYSAFRVPRKVVLALEGV